MARLLRLRNGASAIERTVNCARGHVRFFVHGPSPSTCTTATLHKTWPSTISRRATRTRSSVLLGATRKLSCSSVLLDVNQDGTKDSELLRETPTFSSQSEWQSSLDPATSHAAVDGAADGAVANEAIELVTQAEDFVALGLGGYSPPGLVQSALEFLHNSAHLPWWASIAAATVVLRLTLFPLAVRMQVNSAKIANINPIAQELHKRMLAYKNIGNKVAEAQEAAKLLAIYREQGVHPLTTLFMMPLVQIPVFISFFLAIKGMAKLPLESMKTGGIYWFTDLTVPDPTYVLPFLACLTFISNIELGGEGGAASSNKTHRNLKMFMRASAILVLPISITFPSGLFMYWITNSLFSTCQILFLKIPKVKQFFGIPKIVRPPTEQ